jgi:hypothetical protein
MEWKIWYQTRHQGLAPQSQRYSQKQPRQDHSNRVLEHHADNPLGSRTQRHADADLGDAPGDGVSEQSIEADGREQRPQAAEQFRQRGDEPLRDDGGIHLIRQRSHSSYWNARQNRTD